VGRPGYQCLAEPGEGIITAQAKRDLSALIFICLVAHNNVRLYAKSICPDLNKRYAAPRQRRTAIME